MEKHSPSCLNPAPLAAAAARVQSLFLSCSWLTTAGATSGHLPASGPDIPLWPFCSWTRVQGLLLCLQLLTALLPWVSTFFLAAQLEPEKKLPFSTLWAPQWLRVQQVLSGHLAVSQTGCSWSTIANPPLCLSPDSIFSSLHAVTPAKSTVLSLPSPTT